MTKPVRSQFRRQLLCSLCGRPKVASRPGARWCSDACRQRAYRGRKKALYMSSQVG